MAPREDWARHYRPITARDVPLCEAEAGDLTIDQIGEIDSFVQQLHGLLQTGASYDSTSTLAKRFIREHTGSLRPGGKAAAKRRLYQGDPDGDLRDVLSVEGAFYGSFPITSNSVRGLMGEDALDALFNLLFRLPVYALDANTASRREEYAAEMLAYCADYLELRNLPSKVSSNTPRRNSSGRKKADYATQQREATLADEWARARDSGVRKADFVKQFGLTVAKFDALLDRVAKRKKRSDK